MRRVDQPAIHAGQLLLWPGPLRLAEQATSPVVTDTGAHQRVFEEFIEAFRTGRPCCDGREGRRRVKLVDAIHHPIRTSEAIELKGRHASWTG